MPPPSVSPPMPVVEMMPPGTASPKAWVAWSTSPQVHPPSARTVRFFGSTRTPFMRDRSMTSPSSHTPKPGALWLPPRTASVSSFSRAKFTALMTSLTLAHRTMKRGRRSIIAVVYLASALVALVPGAG